MEKARRGMSHQVQSFPDYKADDFVVSKFYSHVAAETFSSSFTLELNEGGAGYIERG